MLSSSLDRVYVFGDSLSDTGNVFNFTNGFIPGPPVFPYEPGRFSNGGVWLDYFTDEFDLTLDPFIIGADDTGINFNFSDDNNGLNYAIGGATSDNDNVGAVPLGLEQQIDVFQSLVQNQSPEEVVDDDLFFLWVGANDYLSFIQDDPTTPDVIETDFPKGRGIKNAVIDVVDMNIGEAVRDIIDLGGENIVIFNLPDLDILPLAQELNKKDRKALNKLTKEHNKRLSNFIEDTEDSNPNVNLIEIDANELFDDIIDDPSDFGFTNVTDNYTGIDLYTGINQAPSVGNPDEFLFFDSVHPNTVAHELIADLVVSELTDEGLII